MQVTQSSEDVNVVMQGGRQSTLCGAVRSFEDVTVAHAGWQAKQAAWRHRAASAATIRSLIDVLLELEQAAARTGAHVADPADRCAPSSLMPEQCQHVRSHGLPARSSAEVASRASLVSVRAKNAC